ncbi:MAG: cytochrome c [Silicimonas sp.]|jgi:cytochrome c556|nr:cytochrome c [Silicimonas sp.]
MSRLTLLISGICVAAVAGVAFAGGHGGNPAVKVRQAHMELNNFNAGVLFAMAKGDVDYDADAASAAASNLAALANLSQRGYWAPGTSTDDLGDQTLALPAIWQEGSKAGEYAGQLREATAALAAVAGDGKEAMMGALGPVGAACTACHKDYRQSN